tara:strand:- start:1577 stop:1948 length:372 start_codon:yes stop_codon:yes gene_type:complete
MSQLLEVKGSAELITLPSKDYLEYLKKIRDEICLELRDGMYGKAKELATHLTEDVLLMGTQIHANFDIVYERLLHFPIRGSREEQEEIVDIIWGDLRAIRKQLERIESDETKIEHFVKAIRKA